MFTLVTRARMLWAMISLIRNPEGNLEQVLMVVNGLDATGGQEGVLEHLPDSALARQGLVEQPRLLPLDYDALRALPEGSLGRAYVRFLDSHDFDPEDIPTQADPREKAHPGTWAIDHLRETHDLWHVLTGFDVDTAGEGGLQAFYLAQVHTPLPLILMAGILLNGLRSEPDEVIRRMDAIARGWAMGRAARPIFGMAWRELWEVPLHEVQHNLNLVPLSARSVAA